MPVPPHHHHPQPQPNKTVKPSKRRRIQRQTTHAYSRTTQQRTQHNILDVQSNNTQSWYVAHQSPSCQSSVFLQRSSAVIFGDYKYCKLKKYSVALRSILAFVGIIRSFVRSFVRSLSLGWPCIIVCSVVVLCCVLFHCMLLLVLFDVCSL